MSLKLFLMGICLPISAAAFAQIIVPPTPKHPVTDDYFGTKVVDSYRWLEDDNSAETKAWVAQQNKVTQDYLSRIPYRDKVHARLEQLWNFAKYTSAFTKSGWLYYYKNDGLQNQSVLYRQKGMDGQPEVFLDPNLLSSDGTVALSSMDLSKNGRFAAYIVSRSGSDWEEPYVKDAVSGKQLDDHLVDLKFTAAAWRGDDGFYYDRYPKPNEADKLLVQNRDSKVYYHKLGTPQSADVLVYEDKEHPLRTTSCWVTEDNRYLIVYTSEGTSGNEVFVRDLSKKDGGFVHLKQGFGSDANVIDNDGDHILIHTNEDAPNFRLVSIDPQHPEKEHWTTVIPEKPEALQSVNTCGGFLFANYLKDASTRVYQYSYQGRLVREILLPGIGTATNFGGERKSKELFYDYTSFSYPSSIFHYDIASGQSTLFKRPEAHVDPNQFETRQVFFPSADGTKVPMFLTYKKGMELNGNNPVLIYGYGGFDIPMTPRFSIANLFFMEQGGIYALVSLRGGSEYGEAWHKAGMLHKKQNVFNDMIGAAQYLIDGHYTSKDKIAIRGGSNGGLLIGACITQRPDLCKVAIAEVGVMDMLRYQKFTIGYLWAVEYGSSDNKDDFAYLYKYSPYHNIKPGVSYPATLVTTADHDDRVVPGHSFKFAARLQECNAGPNPALIRIESKAGHGGGMPTSKLIAETADIYSFIMFNLGMNYQ